MKTTVARRQELEGLLRTGRRSASRVIDRYIEVCNDILPIENIAAFLINKILECEQSARLISDKECKLTEANSQGDPGK